MSLVLICVLLAANLLVNGKVRPHVDKYMIEQVETHR
jgi:hypothetical protein